MVKVELKSGDRAGAKKSGSVMEYSIDFCPAASVESKYGQWNRSHARAWDTSFFHSRISLVSLMITRGVSALEDQFAWSSHTSLATLMSGARAPSSCSCIRHTLA